jgi:hypothetical protein
MEDYNMAGKSHGRSRRKTPWDKKKELTPAQEFLMTHYREHYEARHPKLSVRDGVKSALGSCLPC